MHKKTPPEGEKEGGGSEFRYDRRDSSMCEYTLNIHLSTHLVTNTFKLRGNKDLVHSFIEVMKAPVIEGVFSEALTSMFCRFGFCRLFDANRRL